MTSGVLIIGEAEQTALREAMARARKKPVPLAELMPHIKASDQATDVVTLAERKSVPPRRDPEMVLIPFGYRVAISFEEQPVGMCLHLSMSSERRPGMLPRPEAVGMVLDALGINSKDLPGRAWIEEYERDGKQCGYAANVVVVMEPATGGHA